MRKFLVLFVLVFYDGLINGQNYLPEWESLDKRPLPGWFEDSKFGIFIHWGVYSVPAWSPPGDSISVYEKYSEWYWNRLMSPGNVGDKFRQYHISTYGPGFEYQDFAPMFRAELFNPGQWTDLFKRSGARYVVLTSKHHEGFALWPSEQSWNWNSVDAGPHRDICGDLTAAVKSAGLHMGFYYSLYEWFNPLYMNEPGKYVSQHMIPQMKDLVTRYKPDIIWTDGEWDRPAGEWNSEEFLAWLYNESPVRENVVVNDRWGKETRGVHGGYFTTEYGLVGDREGLGTNGSHPWEECRGIGSSFGFSRTENSDDYSTTEELVRILVSTVAAGGNLLLDIGPAADGTIPAIMQQRLLDIGKWLETNGEAIYGTRAFIRDKADEAINPQANKTLFFTTKNKDLYMICTEWPGDAITLTNIKISAGASAEMLGTDKPVAVKISPGNLTLSPPDLTPDDYQPAYVFRIKGISRVNNQ